MNPSNKSRAIVAERSVEDVREAGQDSLERIMLAVDLLTVAGDLTDELADGIRERIKVASGALNVLAARAT